MEVYLDNGASTKTDIKVVKAMNPYFTKYYGNASSAHSFGLAARKAVEKSRSIISKKIGAEPNELIFTSGGTESDNAAIIGAALANIDKGNHIISSNIEHPAVMNTLKYLESKGFKVSYLNVDSDGLVNIKELESAITNKTILITIMHANNEIGSVQDIQKIGRIARSRGVLFHTDSVQSFTKEEIDVKKQFIDLASFSSHKIHGPKGVGAMFIRKGVNILPLLHGGGHEFNKRAGTENVSGIVGFAKAVELSNEKYNTIMRRLRDYAINNILKIKNSRLNGSFEKRLVNNINVSFKGIEGEAVLSRLDNAGIMVSTGSACSSKSLELSHVLKAINVPSDYIQGSIRVTLSRFTSKKEIDYFINVLQKVVKELSEMSPYGV
ncbi:Cysteine desulfurase IscS 2 [Candidatus Tiddalikarchaeum anstoanum]|nr:Cysteine desulfurase IscS 2 [Candidatus Tiddalikarchaeum anstoanum]